jgi:hypothetical protein
LSSKSKGQDSRKAKKREVRYPEIDSRRSVPKTARAPLSFLPPAPLDSLKGGETCLFAGTAAAAVRRSIAAAMRVRVISGKLV